MDVSRHHTIFNYAASNSPTTVKSFISVEKGDTDDIQQTTKSLTFKESRSGRKASDGSSSKSR